jgi:hypothetical protein
MGNTLRTGKRLKSEEHDIISLPVEAELICHKPVSNLSFLTPLVAGVLENCHGRKQ